MKRNVCYGITMIILAGFIAAGCSLDKYEKTRGTIVSLDSEKNEVVINVKKTGQQKTIIVTADDMKKLQPGLKISALLKKGSNIAESVKVKMIKPPKTGKQGGPGDKDRNEQEE